MLCCRLLLGPGDALDVNLDVASFKHKDPFSENRSDARKSTLWTNTGQD